MEPISFEVGAGELFANEMIKVNPALMFQLLSNNFVSVLQASSDIFLAVQGFDIAVEGS